MGQIMRPVDVISLCQSDGAMRPIRIRLMDDNMLYRRIDIDHILRQEKIMNTGAEAELYLCQALLDERKIVFELKYFMRSHCWCITGKKY